MNSVCLIGRLTKDIELNKTPTGKTVTRFNLAVRRTKEVTDFISCEAWGKTAEFLGQYTSKGIQIGINGSIQVDAFQTRDGKTAYATKVRVGTCYLLEKKKQAQNEGNWPYDVDPTLAISEDDLPF